jgi:hypothetical protein
MVDWRSDAGKSGCQVHRAGCRAACAGSAISIFECAVSNERSVRPEPLGCRKERVVAARHIALLTLALVAQLRLQPVLPTDPATDLVRVRAMLTTTSTAVDLSLDGAEWANAISPDQNVRVTIDGRTIHVTRRIAGEAAYDDADLTTGACRGCLPAPAASSTGRSGRRRWITELTGSPSRA